MKIIKFISFLLLFSIFLTGCSKVHEVTVSEIRWERSIEIGLYKWVEEESFTRPPSDARNVTSKKVFRRFDDDGNAIYQKKYYYEIEKWVHERTVSTNGTNKEPYWGETNLKEKEREAERYEQYFVKGRNQEDKDIEFTLPYEEWCTVDIDKTIYVDIFWGSGNLTTKPVED